MRREHVSFDLLIDRLYGVSEMRVIMSTIEQVT